MVTKYTTRSLDALCKEMRVRLLEGGVFSGRPAEEIRADIHAKLQETKLTEAALLRKIAMSLDAELLHDLKDNKPYHGISMTSAETKKLLEIADINHLRLLSSKGVNLSQSIWAISEASLKNEGLKEFVLHDLGASDFIVREGLAYDEEIWQITDKALLADFLRLQVIRFPQHATQSSRLMLGVNAVDRFLALLLAGVSLPRAVTTNHDRVRILQKMISSNHGYLRIFRELGSLESYLDQMSEKTDRLLLKPQ